MTELGSEFYDVAQKLPCHVGTMLEYAKDIDPAVVVVCDRDARPLGHVFERLAEVEGYDVPVRYKRISKRLGANAAQATDLVTAHCEDLRELVHSADRPARIMVIDDYVGKAGTVALFRTAMRRLSIDNAELHWTTLTGRGTALNVLPYASPTREIPWRDREDIIGVRYDGMTPQIVETELSRQFYGLLDESVDRSLTRAA